MSNLRGLRKLKRALSSVYSIPPPSKLTKTPNDEAIDELPIFFYYILKSKSESQKIDEVQYTPDAIIEEAVDYVLSKSLKITLYEELRFRALSKSRRGSYIIAEVCNLCSSVFNLMKVVYLTIKIKLEGIK